MTKIIEIKKCNDCKWFLPWSTCLNPMTHKDLSLDINDFGKIPSWCPLPDKTEVGGK